MSEENVEIVRRSVKAFNEGGFEARTARGKTAAKETYAAFDAAWEEHQTELKEVRELPEDEVLVSSVEHFRGRDGMEVSAPCWTILTFRDAKIVKFRPFWDRAQALKAAGLSE